MLEEESPVKKLRPSDESSKKAKIDLVKVAGEDLYHVDEELSPAAEEVDEEDWEEEALNACGVMENTKPRRIHRSRG